MHVQFGADCVTGICQGKSATQRNMILSKSDFPLSSEPFPRVPGSLKKLQTSTFCTTSGVTFPGLMNHRMMSLLPSVPDDPEFFTKLRAHLKTKHSEHVRFVYAGSIAEFPSFFSFAAQPCPSDFQPSEWNHLRYTFYVFLMILWLPPSIIPDIPFDTDSGGVFHAITHFFLLSDRPTHHFDALKDVFRTIHDILLNPHQRSFFQTLSVSPIFYMHNIPKLMHDSLPGDQAFPLFISCVDDFTKSDPKYWTDSDLSFLSEIIRLLTAAKRLPIDRIRSFFNKVFWDQQISPSARFLYFFPVWKPLHISANPEYDPEHRQAKRISELFLELSYLKRYDFP
jgi:hypothetical protein